MKNNLEVWLGDLPEGVAVSVVHDDDMDVLRFVYNGCAAVVGCGYINERHIKRPWATVYSTDAPATAIVRARLVYLLSGLKIHYEKHGYDFGASEVSGPARRFLRDVLLESGIKEYV